jgi:hypothetical protein
MSFKIIRKKFLELLFGKKEKTPSTSFITTAITQNSPSISVSENTLELSLQNKEEYKVEPQKKDEVPKLTVKNIDKELLTINGPPHPPSGFEKYGYNKPLIIKLTNIKNPDEVKIFISVKQICESLGIKPKKIYACLASKENIFNNKYKLEIISFPICGEINKIKIVDTYETNVEMGTTKTIDIFIEPKKAIQFIDLDFKVLPTGMEFSSGTNLQMKIKNMRKHKFVSIADKTPNLIKEWDELNNGISADKVPHALKEKAFWICPLCGSRYERRIDNRTRRAESGCTKCIKKK